MLKRKKDVIFLEAENNATLQVEDKREVFEVIHGVTQRAKRLFYSSLGGKVKDSLYNFIFSFFFLRESRETSLLFISVNPLQPSTKMEGKLDQFKYCFFFFPIHSIFLTTLTEPPCKEAEENLWLVRSFAIDQHHIGVGQGTGGVEETVMCLKSTRKF